MGSGGLMNNRTFFGASFDGVHTQKTAWLFCPPLGMYGATQAEMLSPLPPPSMETLP